MSNPFKYSPGYPGKILIAPKAGERSDAVFLTHLLSELSDACILTLSVFCILSIHPCWQRRSQSHGNDGEIDMGAETVDACHNQLIASLF